jgi:hypothetical protein
MATVMKKRNVVSVKGKFKVISKQKNGKKESSFVSGIWSRKFYNPNGLEKQNQNF